MHRALKLLSLVCIATILPACATTTVSGVVYEGAISTAALVESGDERFERSGLSGVEVSVLSPRTALSITELGHATTDDRGRFRVSLASVPVGVDRVQIRFEASGYLVGQITLPLPTASQRVYATLRASPAPRRAGADDQP